MMPRTSTIRTPSCCSLTPSSFSNYWFESGTPTFLIKRLHQDNFDVRELDHLEVGELAFSTYDIDRLAIIPLLFRPAI